MATPDRPLVLVGAGRMGGAMLDGWLASGHDPRTIVVVEPAPPDNEAMMRPGLRVVPTPPGGKAEVLVIAVKPQVMAEVLPGLTPLRDPDTLVISIAAGITVDALRTIGPGPVVRAIPNTPAAIMMGMTAAFASGTTQEQRETAHKVLSGFGEVAWVDDEGLIDAATAVSGSGPAYVFHLTECLAEAGVAVGLPADVAAMLARQTVIGAGALLDRSDLDPDELRRNVTSAGGTTAAALDVLQEDGALKALLTRAVEAATARSRELGS